jgi:hypothetical protein
MRPLLIGMDNPVSQRPEHALYPHPVGCTGWRLWKMVCLVREMERHQYCAQLERMNLVTGSWNMAVARKAAADLLFSGRLDDRNMCLLGTDVWRAFGLPLAVPACGSHRAGSTTTFYRVPHPSGRNLWYNDVQNRRQVGRLIVGLMQC